MEKTTDDTDDTDGEKEWEWEACATVEMNDMTATQKRKVWSLVIGSATALAAGLYMLWQIRCAERGMEQKPMRSMVDMQAEVGK